MYEIYIHSLIVETFARKKNREISEINFREISRDKLSRVNVMLLQKGLFSWRKTQISGQILMNKEFRKISRDKLLRTLNLMRFCEINFRENGKNSRNRESFSRESFYG